ncbi:MAG: fused DSP-PTPase phosphatase/NAD kinase-like protein [Planctomycetia bacterium]
MGLARILPRMTTRRWILASLAALLVLGGWVGWYVDSRWPWYHFATVVPGGLYRAGQPAPEDVALARERYGIKTLVNLRAERTPQLEAAREACRQQGVTFVDIPLREGQPPTQAQAEQLLALYDDPARRPLLFHCQYGSIRSAAVEALYRVEALGESAEQALDRVRTFGHDLERKYPQIPAWVRAYVPRRARGPAQPVPAAAPVPGTEPAATR